MRRQDVQKRVLVYTSLALPPQHRFIEYPLRRCTEWSPVLLCASRSRESVSLEGLEVMALDPDWPRWLHWSVRRLRGMANTVSARDVRRVRAIGASVLHAHWATNGVLVAPLARALRIPLVVTLHGFDIQSRDAFWTSGQGGWWHRDYPDRLRALARDGTQFVAVSDAVRRLAISRGIPSSQVHHLPVGIDTTLFHPTTAPMSARPPKVLFVANHIERKGGAVLIQAMAKVRRTVPDAFLVMVGDGPERNAWQRLAASLSVPVTFRGRVTPEEVSQEFEDTVVFCLPSMRLSHHDLAEAFGLVVVEAAASGVPVVTSAQGLQSEGVDHGVTGFAVPDRDSDALADRIAVILQDRAMAQRFGDAGPRFVRSRFDVANCTRAVEHLYDRVVRSAA